MLTVTPTTHRTAYDVAAQTPDPELPIVTIADLGILRGVETVGDKVVVTITPTYSGCPAMREIAADIAARLDAAGFGEATVRFALSPAWTTEWITEDGRAKLAEAGIAPPAPPAVGPVPIMLGRPRVITCPRCGSHDTVTVAAFGATACKSLHRCKSCAEPFEAVKSL